MSMPPHSHRRPGRSRRNALLAAGGVGGALLLLQIRGGIGKGSGPAASTLDPMAAELLQAAERANLCAASNAVGVGLRAEYFSETGLRGSVVLARVDDVVDFDASIRQLVEAGGQLVASARWTGWIKPPLSGKYRFHADAPGMTVRVAHAQVAGDGAPDDVKVNLAVGRFYPVEVVVNEFTDSPSRIRLEWTAPHGSRFVVPRALLHLPSETVAARLP